MDDFEVWFYWTLLFLAIGVAYAVSCWRWPLTDCLRSRCEAGKIYRRSKRTVWRECWWCKGTGKRMRVGRRIFNWFHARHREAR